MEPEKQANPPPYSPEQYPQANPGQYPPPQPQPYAAQPYPQYPAAPVGTQPPPVQGPYPPQPPQPTAAAGQQSTTVVVTAPAVVVGQHQYGYDPCRTICPYCQADIVTNIDHVVGGLAWMICGIILLVGLFFWCVLLGCCFIPFCIPDCKDVVHICPNCKQTLGRVPRLK